MELDTYRTFAATCWDCKIRADMRPKAGRIVVYTHGVMVLEFFCTKCRGFNRHPLTNLDVARELRRAGLPTSVEHTPTELSEHPPKGTPPITIIEVENMELCNPIVFDQFLVRELGL